MLIKILDQILDDIIRWMTKALLPHWKVLKPRLAYFGLPFLLTWILFPVLAFGSGAHWWHWNAWIVRALLTVMIVFAIVYGMVYGLLAPIVILGIWRGKAKIARHKQARMQLNFLAVAVLYGLVASWGLFCLVGHNNRFLLHCGLIVYFGLYIANLVLYGFERRGARLSAV